MIRTRCDAYERCGFYTVIYIYDGNKIDNVRVIDKDFINDSGVISYDSIENIAITNEDIEIAYITDIQEYGCYFRQIDVNDNTKRKSQWSYQQAGGYLYRVPKNISVFVACENIKDISIVKYMYTCEVLISDITLTIIKLLLEDQRVDPTQYTTV